MDDIFVDAYNINLLLAEYRPRAGFRFINNDDILEVAVQKNAQLNDK
jgi:hypothetical protein